ncbi:conserved membrane hypothetical protein [groundwater metagenome]|uniref:DUF4013 domain-containing protein n=1 Tax=groundwater metagenome TaxID=717931 RepID=A0A098EET4_9ZZZZ
MDFVEPLVYPLKDIKKLVLGGLMILPGMFLLLIPLIIASGYSIRVAGDTVRGKNDLPEFDRWWALFIKGLGSVLIYIVYFLLFIIILFLPAILYFVIGGVSHNTALMGIIFLIIMIVLAIVLAIIGPIIACVKYGEEENIGAAFKFNEIYRNLRANVGNYIIGTLIYVVLYILILVCTVFLGITGSYFLPSGIIFIFPIAGIMSFYFSLITMRMYAGIYKESKGKLGKSTLQPETAHPVHTEYQGKNGLGNRDEWEELK